MTLAVAGVAAAAIFLIAIGIATSGGGSAVSMARMAWIKRRTSGSSATNPNAGGSNTVRDWTEPGTCAAAIKDTTPP